jgi:hypothetical protein
MALLPILRISADSFITPLRVYHKEVKKTFTPYTQKTIKGKLLDLIKRIIVVLASPVLYPVTLSLAAVGYGLKGICKLLPKKTLAESSALRMVVRGQYDKALIRVNQSSDIVQNRIKEAICLKIIERESTKSDPVLSNTINLVKSIVSDTALQNRLYILIAQVFISAKNSDRASTLVDMIDHKNEELSLEKTKLQIEICLISYDYNIALQLLSQLKNQIPNTPKELYYRDFIENKCKRIYAGCDLLDNDQITYAEVAIGLIIDDKQKYTTMCAFIERLISLNKLEWAERLTDQLPLPGDLASKDFFYSKIAKDFVQSGNKEKANVVFAKISDKHPDYQTVCC